MGSAMDYLAALDGGDDDLLRALVRPPQRGAPASAARAASASAPEVSLLARMMLQVQGLQQQPPPVPAPALADGLPGDGWTRALGAVGGAVGSPDHPALGSSAFAMGASTSAFAIGASAPGAPLPRPTASDRLAAAYSTGIWQGRASAIAAAPPNPFLPLSATAAAFSAALTVMEAEDHVSSAALENSGIVPPSSLWDPPPSTPLPPAPVRRISSLATASPPATNFDAPAALASSSPLAKPEAKPTTRKRPAACRKDDKEGEPATKGGEPPTKTCCICLDEPTRDDLAKIDGCTHPFCFGCIEKWAERENKCPLCKERFHSIEKVHPTKKRKGDGDVQGERKRVCHRDQRSDLYSSFGGNPLENIYASMEANGTWPSHIAQLLFSGVGGSSLGGRGITLPSLAATRRTTPSFPAAASEESVLAAVARRQRQRQAANNVPRRPPGGTASSTIPRSAAVSHSLGQRFGGVAPSSGGTRPSSSWGGADPFAPPTPPTMATARASRNTSTPWSARTSVSVTVGPQGFAGRSSSDATSSFQSLFGASASRRSSAMSAGESGGEEEDLLSALSPSSYIDRLYQQLEGAAPSREDQHRFDVGSTGIARAGAAATWGTFPTQSISPALHRGAQGQGNLGRQNVHSGSATATATARAAGRSVATALDLTDSDDDDVVEVIDVEALI